MSESSGELKTPMEKKREVMKQKSWSAADIRREAAWQRRKESFRCQSLEGRRCLTDDDLEELQGCIDLGFGFHASRSDPNLTSTFPALEFYYAVNKQCEESLSRSSSSLTNASDTGTTPSSVASATSIFDAGDDPKTLKTKIKHWAKVVGCVVRQYSPRK